MSAKTSAARREAFFKALAETGNQTISAERARVSRSWVSLHRSADPAFKARMEAAIAEARERLSSAGSVKSSGKWATIDGEELVVRGSRRGRVQVSRARLKQWTARVEARFLAVLSQTCNVTLACRAVGLSPQSAYGHYDRWPTFAARWDAAVEDGSIHLECGLLENACNSLSGPDDTEYEGLVPALPIEPMSADDAIRLLGLHRRTATGHGKYAGGKKIRATEEEATAAILRAIDMLEHVEARRGAVEG